MFLQWKRNLIERRSCPALFFINGLSQLSSQLKIIVESLLCKIAQTKLFLTFASVQGKVFSRMIRSGLEYYESDKGFFLITHTG